MSGIEQAFLIGGLIITVFGKPLLKKLLNRRLKKVIVKNTEKALVAADFIYKQLKEFDLELPIVDELLEKIQTTANSELGSKKQKNKSILRLLKRLDGDVLDEALELVEVETKLRKKQKKLEEEEEKFKTIFKTLDVQVSDVSALAMRAAQAFRPDEEEVELTPAMSTLQKVRARGKRR